MGAAPPPGPFRLPAVRSRGTDRRQRGYSRYAAERRQLDSLRHIRHRLYPVGVSPHPVVDGKVRHRADRYSFQLQRQVRRPGLRPRFRFGHQGAAATRDCEVPAGPQAPAPDRLAEPFPVEAAQRPRPVQLHQHGGGSEPGGLFRRLQVQDPQADVRQFPDGDRRVLHACVPLREVSRVLRHRNRHAHEHLGPGNAEHLRKPVGRTSGTGSASTGLSGRCTGNRPASWSRTKRVYGRSSTR